MSEKIINDMNATLRTVHERNQAKLDLATRVATDAIKAVVQTGALDSLTDESREWAKENGLIGPQELTSDELFIRCVMSGADRAAVAGWPDFRRREFLGLEPLTSK